MIHRQYVCKLAPLVQAYPPLDIMVRVPGTYAAPVNNPALYGGVGTAAPAAWIAACGANWYYESRPRAVRLEHLAAEGAAAGFTARFRLGGYLSIVPLDDQAGLAPVAGTVPSVSISASLAPNPISNPLLGVEIGAFADPAYGPVIRLRNSASLYGLERATGVLFLVSLGIAENKDEDWANLGHA
jgi:hypothetical protein